jgi:nucleotide-binding universal stress UspA family protein
MKVLVPYDGSEQAEDALRYAVRKHGDADIVALHVIDPVGKGGEKGTRAAWWNMWYEDREKLAEQRLEEVHEIAEDEGRDVTTDLSTGKPSEEIIEYAREENVDLIVMGRQGETGLSRVLLGSSAENVARHSDIPVTLVGETN